MPSISSAAGERDSLSRVTAHTRRIGLPAAHRPQLDVGVIAGELRQDRHAETAGDEALDHLVLLALEADPGLESRVAADLEHLLTAGAGQLPAEPVLVGEVLDPDRLRGGQRVAGRQRDPHRLLVDQLGLDVAGELERERRVVEDDGEVEVAPLQGRERVLRLVLGELELDLGEALAEERERASSSASRSPSGSSPAAAGRPRGRRSGRARARPPRAGTSPRRRGPSGPRRRRSASARRWSARAARCRPRARGRRSAGSPPTARDEATRRPLRRSRERRPPGEPSNASRRA